MWYIIIILILLFLFRKVIGNWLAKLYAKGLMKDPDFIKIKESAEAEYKEYNSKKDQILNNTAKIILEDNAMRWLQKAIDEMQDVDKGIALHLLREKIIDLYGVDWPTAAECVKTGLASGKLHLKPINKNEFAIVRQMFKVTERS